MVNILVGHKCHQQMSIPPTTRDSINGSTHFDFSTKTLADKSSDETRLGASSYPINCDQKATNSGAKDVARHAMNFTPRSVAMGNSMTKAYKLHVKFESGRMKYKV